MIKFEIPDLADHRLRSFQDEDGSRVAALNFFAITDSITEFRDSHRITLHTLANEPLDELRFWTLAHISGRRFVFTLFFHDHNLRFDTGDMRPRHFTFNSWQQPVYNFIDAEQKGSFYAVNRGGTFCHYLFSTDTMRYSIKVCPPELKEIVYEDHYAKVENVIEYPPGLHFEIHYNFVWLIDDETRESLFEIPDHRSAKFMLVNGGIILQLDDSVIVPILKF